MRRNYIHSPSYQSIKMVIALILVFCAWVGVGSQPAAAEAEGRIFFVVTDPLIIRTDCTQAIPCSLDKAVSQAKDGDSIYLAQGIYKGTGSQVLDISKSITLQGGWSGNPSGKFILNPEKYRSVLDGEDSRRVINISGSAAPRLIGLTIQNGKPVSDFQGGGVRIETTAAEPVTIENSIIQDNFASTYGGAVALKQGWLKISGSRILQNSVNAGGGGAIIAGKGTSIELVRNIATHNDAPYGSLLHSDGAAFVKIWMNRITDNTGENSSPISINGKYSPADPEVYVEIESNIIADNSGTGVTTTYTLTLFANHNTIVKNTGSGITVSDQSTVTIKNSIFAGNDFDSINGNPVNSENIHHNLFYNNGFGDPYTGDTDILGTDPLLTSDYHLQPDSPAVDAGAPGTGLFDDIDGELRSPDFPDIGADEVTNELSVELLGNGSGTVISTAYYIDCGTRCAASIATDRTVDLLAFPDDGSVFGGWGGDCSGTGDCSLSMESAHTVTARFTRAYRTYLPLAIR